MQTSSTDHQPHWLLQLENANIVANEEIAHTVRKRVLEDRAANTSPTARTGQM